MPPPTLNNTLLNTTIPIIIHLVINITLVFYVCISQNKNVIV
jgi:hypothetical protein